MKRNIISFQYGRTMSVKRFALSFLVLLLVLFWNKDIRVCAQEYTYEDTDGGGQEFTYEDIDDSGQGFIYEDIDDSGQGFIYEDIDDCGQGFIYDEYTDDCGQGFTYEDINVCAQDFAYEDIPLEEGPLIEDEIMLLAASPWDITTLSADHKQYYYDDGQKVCLLGYYTKWTKGNVCPKTIKAGGGNWVNDVENGGYENESDWFLSVYGITGNSTVNWSDTTITLSSAYYGSCIFVESGSTLNLTNIVITGGSGSKLSNFLVIAPGATVNMYNCSYSGGCYQLAFNLGNLNIYGGSFYEDRTAGGGEHAVANYTGGKVTLNSYNGTAPLFETYSGRKMCPIAIYNCDNYTKLSYADKSAFSKATPEVCIYDVIIGHYGSGVYNVNGKVEMFSGKISECDLYEYALGKRNYDTHFGFTFSGIYNRADLRIYGGDISNNTFGIAQYGGILNQYGDIGANVLYGVMLIAGAYNCHGVAVTEPINQSEYGTKTASIYLNENLTFDITIKPERFIGTVIVPAADRLLGRPVAVCKWETGEDLNNGNTNQLDKTLYIQDNGLLLPAGFSIIDADNLLRNDLAVIRACNDINISELYRKMGYGVGSLVLSANIDVSYDSLLKKDYGDYGIVVSLPESETDFWKEGHTVTEETPSVLYDGTNISPSIVFRCWGLPSHIHPDTGKPLTYQSGQRIGCDQTDRDITLWDGWQIEPEECIYYYDTNFNLLYDGNDATKGANKLVHNINDEYTLEKNWFFKSEAENVYDSNAKAYEEYLFDFSHQGWSFKRNSAYKDEDIYKSGTQISSLGYKNILDIFLKDIVATKTDKDKEPFYVIRPANGQPDSYMVTLIMYCVWDRFPRIDSIDSWYSRKDLLNMSKEELEKAIISRAKASDREDDDVLLSKDIEVIELDIDELRSIKVEGGSSATLKVTDGAGNTAYRPVRIYVSGSWNENPNSSQNILVSFLRFIDRENYEKSSPLEGSLLKDSVWYMDEEYRRIIEKAFDNLEVK